MIRDLQNGTATNLPNLDVTRRRLNVTRSPATAPLSTPTSSKRRHASGAVETLTLDGTETDLIPNLGEPVGCRRDRHDGVSLSDQATNTIVSDARPQHRRRDDVRADRRPDLMTPGPDGTLFSGSAMGNVYQISATGDVTTFQSGFMATRDGVKPTTPINKRLFVAEHVTTGTVHALHIFPVGP